MIDDSFKERMQSGLGCAVIMAGSGSDDKPKGDKESHIEQIAEGLEKWGIPYQVRICSAHKQPGALAEMIGEYDAIKGSYVIIAVAGGTDALSGTASFHALAPVISCPPDAPNETCLTNPPGSPNAYIARPSNVGKFVAQMYAGANPDLREKLIAANQKKIGSLVEADQTLMEKYAQRQAGGNQ